MNLSEEIVFNPICDCCKEKLATHRVTFPDVSGIIYKEYNCDGCIEMFMYLDREGIVTVFKETEDSNYLRNRYHKYYENTSN